MKNTNSAVSTMKTKKGLLDKGKKIGMQQVPRAIHTLTRSGIHGLARFTRRGFWLSYQYFELGSLINLYLKAREANDNARLEDFTLLALSVLRGYKARVYRRFKRTIAMGKRKTPSPSSIETAVFNVYKELKTVAHRYWRKRSWRQVFHAAASLIREAIGR